MAPNDVASTVRAALPRPGTTRRARGSRSTCAQGLRRAPVHSEQTVRGRGGGKRVAVYVDTGTLRANSRRTPLERAQELRGLVRADLQHWHHARHRRFLGPWRSQYCEVTSSNVRRTLVSGNEWHPMTWRAVAHIAKPRHATYNEPWSLEIHGTL